MYKPILLVTSLAALGACSTDDEERCADPKYGNGTCDVQTSCGEPDIDCFTTFETQAEAQAWYSTTPAATMRPPLPATDPRFERVQGLIDEGWEAYKSINPVGDLASAKVHLVLADQRAANAFVVSKEGSAGLVIMVAPPLLELGAPDEEVMGIIMHELEHIIGLHVLPEVKAAFNRYYLAPAGSEPLGFEQADNPMVRALVEEWIDHADITGYLADVELRGLPMLGQLFDVFEKRLAMQPSTAACNTAKATFSSIRATIITSRNLLDDSVTLTATAPTTILNAMSALQTQCFAGFTQDAIDVVAAHYNVTRATMLTEIEADLRPMLEGVAYIQGMYNWGIYERSKLREIEARFQQMTGQPWSRARYFSTEEAADDSSVPVLRGMGLAADGGGRMVSKLVPGLEAICRPLVNADQPVPYGEQLDDGHHGTCWRAAHIKAVAAVDQPRAAAPRPRLHKRRPTLFTPAPKPYSH